MTPHYLALGHMRETGQSLTVNCGYGHGFSVRELLQAVEKANGAPLKIIETERRAGDPPELVAGAEKVRQALGWQPQYDNLDTIAESSLAWEKSQLVKPWNN